MESNSTDIEGRYQPLVLRLQTAVAQMAHHQRDRQNGRLLIECLDAIKTMDEINSRRCQEWAEDMLEALQMLMELEPNAESEICSYERGCWEHAREAIERATGRRGK